MLNRVLSRAEYGLWLRNDRRTPIYIESKQRENERGWVPDNEDRLPLVKYYGELFRAWTFKPTDDERKSVMW